MSEQGKSKEAINKGRAHVRASVVRLRDSRKFAMLGLPEIVGLACSGILLLAVVVSYFYFLTPAYSRVKSVEQERARLDERVRAAQQGINPDASPQVTVDEISASLEQFERNALVQATQGRMDLYTELNSIMLRHKLRNTAGPVYVTLDPVGAPGAEKAAASTGNAKWQSLYPGVEVSVTVEGPYANLRHFLSDLESSRHFIIVNSVELEGVTDADSQTGSTVVSLHLDMTTYFRRSEIATNN